MTNTNKWDHAQSETVSGAFSIFSPLRDFLIELDGPVSWEKWGGGCEIALEF